MAVRLARQRTAVLGICALAVLATVQVASAQTSPSAMLDQFRAVRMTRLSTAAAYANRLFGLLAVIEFAWTAAILLLERTDLQGWTAALIRKMMFIGAFFALLTFGTPGRPEQRRTAILRDAWIDDWLHCPVEETAAYLRPYADDKLARQTLPADALRAA